MIFFGKGPGREVIVGFSRLDLGCVQVALFGNLWSVVAPGGALLRWKKYVA